MPILADPACKIVAACAVAYMKEMVLSTFFVVRNAATTNGGHEVEVVVLPQTNTANRGGIPTLTKIFRGILKGDEALLDHVITSVGYRM